MKSECKYIGEAALFNDLATAVETLMRLMAFPPHRRTSEQHDAIDEACKEIIQHTDRLQEHFMGARHERMRALVT